MSRTARSREPTLTGLEKLAALRGKLPPHGAAADETGDTGRRARADTLIEGAREADANSAAQGLDDVRLFRDSLRDVVPIKDTGRAELDVPKPAPVPRPRTAPDEVPTALPHPGRSDQLSDSALFLEMVADVTRLEFTGRADLAPEPRRAGALPRAMPSGDDLACDPAPPLLPADPERLPDQELFRHATQGTLPIDQRNRADLSCPRPSPEPIKRFEDERAVLRETMEAPMTLEDRLEIGEEAAFLRAGLPRRVLIDLRRGRWVLQGELDLHGLKREEARGALAEFLSASLQQGRRCVRVIHGKGHGSPGKESILKQLSRGWLAQREEILAFCQAGPHHGGSGALMVLLRGPNAGRN